jgi:hypothetical protein
MTRVAVESRRAVQFFVRTAAVSAILARSLSCSAPSLRIHLVRSRLCRAAAILADRPSSVYKFERLRRRHAQRRARLQVPQVDACDERCELVGQSHT